MDPSVAGNGAAPVEPSGDAYGAETPPAPPEQAPEAPAASAPASPPVAPAAPAPAAPAASDTTAGYTPEHWTQAAQYVHQNQTQVAQTYAQLEAKEQAAQEQLRQAAQVYSGEQLQPLIAQYQSAAAERTEQMRQLELQYQHWQHTAERLGTKYEQWQWAQRLEPLARADYEQKTEVSALAKVPGLSESERPTFLRGLHQFIKGRTYHDARDMAAVADAYVELWRGNVLAQRQAEGTDFMGGAGSGVTDNIDALRGDQLWDRVAYKNTPPARKR